MIRFVVAVFLPLLPLRLMAQGQTELLISDRAASGLSSDSGLVVALAKFLNQNGVLLWPGAPVVAGREQSEQLMRAIPSYDSLRLTWQPLAAELSRDSLLGITWGVTVMLPRRTPGAPLFGRYIAAWQRESGRWTISALLFMGVKPLAASVPAGIPLMRSPAPANGPAAPFVTADLAFARLALDSGAVTAFRAWAAPDAIVSDGAGLLRRGPEAIASGVAGPAVWRWHPVAAGTSGSGDLGWTVGEAVITPTTGEPSHSKYLTVWRRPPGGPIRFLTDGGNPRPATVDRR